MGKNGVNAVDVKVIRRMPYSSQRFTRPHTLHSQFAFSELQLAPPAVCFRFPFFLFCDLPVHDCILRDIGRRGPFSPADRPRRRRATATPPISCCSPRSTGTTPLPTPPSLPCILLVNCGSSARFHPNGCGHGPREHFHEPHLACPSRTGQTHQVGHAVHTDLRMHGGTGLSHEETTP